MGSVETGKIADLVLLDGNPLQDIGNTRRVAGVFAQGRYYSRQDLDGMLAARPPDRASNAAKHGSSTVISGSSGWPRSRRRSRCRC